MYQCYITGNLVDIASRMSAFKFIYSKKRVRFPCMSMGKDFFITEIIVAEVLL